MREMLHVLLNGLHLGTNALVLLYVRVQAAEYAASKISLHSLVANVAPQLALQLIHHLNLGLCLFKCSHQLIGEQAMRHQAWLVQFM